MKKALGITLKKLNQSILINDLKIIQNVRLSSNNCTNEKIEEKKAEKISKAMKIYLERAQSHNKFMEKECEEFELGKSYLCKMMNLDEQNLTQQDIDEAIQYLLPSGLFEPKALPKMKPPHQILPIRKAAQFGLDGRPFNSFFYTGKQNYSQTIHEIQEKLNDLKMKEDQMLSRGQKIKQEMQIQLSGSQWLGEKEMNKKLGEVLSSQEYKLLLENLELLSGERLAGFEKKFIFNYRFFLQKQNQQEGFKKLPMLKDEEGNSYQQAEGKRKKAFSKVKVIERGTGKVEINGIPLFHHFPRLADREQILFPLHLMDMLGKVDIYSEVTGGGSSGQAGSIRLGISRCLQHMVSSEKAEKLRLAGLLTYDPRTLERQKPGQQGARRKYTWKKR